MLQSINNFWREYIYNIIYSKICYGRYPSILAKDISSYYKYEINANYSDSKNDIKIRKHANTFTSKTLAVISFVISQTYDAVSTDHLVDMCWNSITDRKIALNVKIHMKVCSEVYKNVLSIYFVEDLTKDFGNAKHSLLFNNCSQN